MCKTITLSGEVLPLLRVALYSRLTDGTDALNAVLMLPDRERSIDAHAAYSELRAAGSLLDRLGWREQDAALALELESPGEARLIIDALTVELGIEADGASTARRLSEPDAVVAAEQRWEAVHAALWSVESQVASAYLTETGTVDDARR